MLNRVQPGDPLEILAAALTAGGCGSQYGAKSPEKLYLSPYGLRTDPIVQSDQGHLCFTDSRGARSAGTDLLSRPASTSRHRPPK